MTPLEQLKAARELISDHDRWTKGESARNAEGRRVDADDAAAVCWCAEGALQKFQGLEIWGSGAYQALRKAGQSSSAARPFSVWSFNDRIATSHADVLALYDKAIAGLEPTCTS